MSRSFLCAGNRVDVERPNTWSRSTCPDTARMRLVSSPSRVAPAVSQSHTCLGLCGAHRLTYAQSAAGLRDPRNHRLCLQGRIRCMSENAKPPPAAGTCRAPRTASKGCTYGDMSWTCVPIACTGRRTVSLRVLHRDQTPRKDRYVMIRRGASANDQFPWVIKLLAYIRRVVADRHSLKICGKSITFPHPRRSLTQPGVCFGHQVIRKVLGSPVEKGKWEISVTTIHLTSIGRALFHTDKLVGSCSPCNAER
ncbi:hypothetical protein JVT61DRAFT_1751 [Boletus reticuloceps]|uniref:Uncharacterized protein n=1 Tax=Boletus reticuloceps TaxID=495285 RepID=A0A8I3A9D2_9AGAM|nr:hypothetical protein JVT61DRAFT_1751 [Boletus reticuloceps]